MTIRSNALARVLLLYSAAVLGLTWVLAPVLWMLITSTQVEINVIATPPHVDFFHLQLNWYGGLLQDPLFVDGLKSSVITSGSTTVLCTVLGSLAAYPLARVHMPRRNAILVGLIATRMVPAMVLIIPLFLLIRQLHLIDTYAALIFVYTVFLLPYVIWMLKNFFEDIPPALEAAARMDGCTRLGALFRVVVPVAQPGVVATAIFCFISAWNEFLFALVLTTKQAKTITVKLAELQGTMYGGIEITKIASAAILGVLPVVLLVILLNRLIVRGLTEGAVKA